MLAEAGGCFFMKSCGSFFSSGAGSSRPAGPRGGLTNIHMLFSPCFSSTSLSPFLMMMPVTLISTKFQHHSVLSGFVLAVAPAMPEVSNVLVSRGGFQFHPSYDYRLSPSRAPPAV